MTPNEKSLIEDLFNRIRSATPPQRDAEADQLIAAQMAQTPGAAYVLAQTVLVQDQALREAHSKVQAAETAQKQAEAQAQQLRAPAGQAQQFQPQPGAAPEPEQRSGSLLDRIGLGTGRGAVPRTGPTDEGGQQGAGGGFMRGALQTAAGVAGGALLFEGVKSMFGGNSMFGGGNNAGSFLGGGSPWGGSGEPQTVVNETIINDYSRGNDRDDDQRARDLADDRAADADDSSWQRGGDDQRAQDAADDRAADADDDSWGGGSDDNDYA